MSRLPSKTSRLIGSATTASEGVVDASELALTPAYRPGQRLETVPGLVVTVHSGEGTERAITQGLISPFGDIAPTQIVPSCR
jgi:hypothetical protein